MISKPDLCRQKLIDTLDGGLYNDYCEQSHDEIDIRDLFYVRFIDTAQSVIKYEYDKYGRNNDILGSRDSNSLPNS